MSDLKGVDDATAALALTRLCTSLAAKEMTAEERAIQRGIARTMAETLRSPPDNFQRDQNQSPLRSGGGEPPRKGTGWVDAPAIQSPPGQDLIEKLVNRMAPQSPEWFLRSAHLTPDQMAELRRMIEADPAKLGWIGEVIDRVEGKG
jgi:hypothetical protein